MEWLNASNVKELKKLGKMRDVQNSIKVDLENYFKEKKSKDKNIIGIIKITSNSWDGLLDKIIALKDFLNQFDKDKIECNEENESIEYFKTEEDKIIFALLELEGRKRNNILGITRKCFMSEKDAKVWRNNLSKKIHPDKSKNKYATMASAKINQLYTEMVGHE
ncbi:hypothetical protein [uncultured Clostridium sp.]|jgi:hypothetical protein|uniref:hypothetical protein n=1 Tax=uncultured Clostridium sp. TaxID=59620 RepID=UPI00261C92B7|nr:hypothetical protein [uncultured Clostridium sp.]